MNPRYFFIILFFVLAVPIAGAATILDNLPTGMKWTQGVNYEIPFSVWDQRTSGLVGVRTPAGGSCGYTIPSTDSEYCDDTEYLWDSNHQIRVGNKTYQCHRVALPDTCSSNSSVPQDKRNAAKCTVVRVHTSATTARDLRACASCASGACDFFIGAGATSLPPTPGPITPQPPTTPTPQPVVTPPGPTQPSPSKTSTNGETGTNPDANGDGCGDNFNVLPAGLCTLEDLVDIILKAVVSIGSILLVLALVWTGFLFIAAQGNEEKIRSARDALVWTVLGGIVLLGAQAFQLIIKSTIESL